MLNRAYELREVLVIISVFDCLFTLTFAPAYHQIHHGNWTDSQGQCDRAQALRTQTESGRMEAGENVPEDIVAIIAQAIRSWSKIEGLASDDERTEARL